MRAPTALALAAAICWSPAAAAKPKAKRKPQAAVAAEVPASKVDVVRAQDGWRADIAFDGPLFGWATPHGHDGRRALVLLVGPKAKPPSKEVTPCTVQDRLEEPPSSAVLYRWRPESPERLETLGTGLPRGQLDVADLDGDGEDELLLERTGAIDVVAVAADGSATLEPFIEDDALVTPSGGPRIEWDALAAVDDAVRVSVLGELRTYRRNAQGKAIIGSELPIPVRLSPRAQGVQVQARPVRPIGRAAGAPRMLFATDPEPLGKRRLRTLLLDPDGPPESHVLESWAMFPEPERVVDSAFAVLQGAPVLIVTTTSADKLSLLGEKALRVFPIGGDRTRAGDAPSFATITGLNLWQMAHPVVVDLDRDGRDDLVLGYWKGLKNTIAALEVYRGTASSFAKPRTLSFDVTDGERGFLEFGTDLDGDGRPDLALLGSHELQVYPGLSPDRAAEKPVESKPSRRVPIPADFPNVHGVSLSMGLEGLQIERLGGGLGAPHLLDVDGDGRPEALFAGNSGAGVGRASIVFIRGAAPIGASANINKE